MENSQLGTEAPLSAHLESMWPSQGFLYIEIKTGSIYLMSVQHFNVFVPLVSIYSIYITEIVHLQKAAAGMEQYSHSFQLWLCLYQPKRKISGSRENRWSAFFEYSQLLCLYAVWLRACLIGTAASCWNHVWWDIQTEPKCTIKFKNLYGAAKMVITLHLISFYHDKPPPFIIMCSTDSLI